MGLDVHTLNGLCCYADARSWRVRLSIKKGEPSVLNRLAVHDKDGDELEAVALAPRHSLNEAAGVLYELLERRISA